MVGMTPADWVLLAVSFAGDRGLSPVQLQKVLFLLAQELPDEVGGDFYRFTPYNYGPFCKRVYQDANHLSESGLVIMQELQGQRWKRFTISSAGAERARELLTESKRRPTEYLRRIVEWASKLSFAELVRAIYQRYPAYRENSVFQG
jgi:hypothetical protein